MASLSMKMTAELRARMDRAADRLGIPRSEFLRRAVESYLARFDAETVDATSIIEDLIGSLEGPGDLSCNPEYLDDLGR